MRSAILICTAAMISLTVAATPLRAAPPKKAIVYDVVNLGNPLGGTYGQGSSITNSSQVGGLDALPGNTVMHAVRWRNGYAPQDLGTLGGLNSAIAWPNRNDSGVMAGVAEASTIQPNGEYWSCALAVFNLAPPTGNVCLGFRWKDGTMTALPTLGGDNGFATGINNRGQIVGWAENTVHDQTCNAPQVLQFEAVMWGPQGEVTQLPPIGNDPDGAATAINQKGQVVGISGLCANAIGGASAEHMALWQSNTVRSLPTLGGQYWNTPMDINEKGDVTGFSDLPGDSAASPNFNAFIWTKHGGTVNLGTLPGDTLSEGLGINDNDQVVGVSYPSGHAFIWQRGTIIDLNKLVARGTSLVLTDAQDINDAGQITGAAQDPNTGSTSAFVAVPKWK